MMYLDLKGGDLRNTKDLSHESEHPYLSIYRASLPLSLVHEVQLLRPLASEEKRYKEQDNSSSAPPFKRRLPASVTVLPL